MAATAVAGYSVNVSRVRFISPAPATHRSSPPAGEQWQYEVKFDGFQVQVHKVGLADILFGKNGGDLTDRFPTRRQPADPAFECDPSIDLAPQIASSDEEAIATAHWHPFGATSLTRRCLRAS
jgi:ATP-dependent DNA ligase